MMWRRRAWLKFSDISEVLTGSIIIKLIKLIVDERSTCEKSVASTTLYVTTHKAVIFIVPFWGRQFSLMNLR